MSETFVFDASEPSEADVFRTINYAALVAELYPGMSDTEAMDGASASLQVSGAIASDVDRERLVEYAVRVKAALTGEGTK